MAVSESLTLKSECMEGCIPKNTGVIRITSLPSYNGYFSAAATFI